MGKPSVERMMDGVTKFLEGTLNRLNLLDGYLNRVVYRKYQNIQRERWASENASQGTAWPGLNEHYKKYKLVRYQGFPGGGRKMMIATKRLFNSVVGDDLADHKKIVTGKSLQILTTVPYAPYANEARNFTQFSPEEIRSIKSDIVNYIVGRKPA